MLTDGQKSMFFLYYIDSIIYRYSNRFIEDIEKAI